MAKENKKLEDMKKTLRDLLSSTHYAELRATEKPTAEQETELHDLAVRARDLSVKIADENALDEVENRSRQATDNPPDKKLNDKRSVGFGKFCQAVATAAGWRSNYALPMAEARSILAERRSIEGMSETEPSSAGFLVDEDEAGMLMNKAYDEGKLARLCQRVPISGPSNGLKWKTIKEESRANGSRQGGILVYRVHEGASLTDSKLTVVPRSMELEKMAGLVYLTDELLQDTSALDSLLSQEFVKAFGFKADDEILNGTGTGEMLGILNAPALVEVSKETGQSAKTFTAENVIKMYARFVDGGNGRWIMNKDVFPQLPQLVMKVGTGGIPLWIPGGSIANAPYGSIMGMPIVYAEQAQTLGTKGDVYLADMSEYRIIEKGGVQAASSIHVQFLTDQTALRFIVRNNGQPLPATAITPYKGSDTVSPFVTLAVRA